MPPLAICTLIKAMHTSQKHHLTLVFDQGSHASRIALFSETAALVHLETQSISTHSPEPGHYEQDANEILHSIRSLLDKLPGKLISQINNASLCTQRSSVVAWHRQTGEALSPVISWRDLRNLEFLNSLEGSQKNIQQITGLPLSGHYSATKMHWLLKNNARVKQAATDSQLCIAPLASYLLFHLLKGRPFVLDHSNAQRSQLFDIQSLHWSDELLQYFHIRKDFLPNCLPMIHNYGELKDLQIPLTAVSGDQNAALHAYPAMQKDKALVNIGTGAFILSTSAERKNSSRLLRSIASSTDDTVSYVTEGTVNGAGNAISWAQDLTANTETQPENIFRQLPQWLDINTSPPVFLNTISGLGSPWWCNGGTAEFITEQKLSQSDRYVAIIESIIFLIYKNIEQLECPPVTIFISGGLSHLDGLCQKLADLSSSKIQRFEETESSARGSAWLANQSTENDTSLNMSLWKNLKIDQQFIPTDNPGLSSRYQQFVGELRKRCHSD